MKVGHVLFKGEIITKIGWVHLEIFFTRITQPILSRRGSNHPEGGLGDSHSNSGKHLTARKNLFLQKH
jgi:hypothetical protein